MADEAKKTVQDITTETLNKGLPEAILGSKPQGLTSDPLDQPRLADLSVKELQAEAVKLGMPEDDAKLFTVKAPLIATINTLKASGAAQQVTTEKITTLNAPPNPQEEKRIEQEHLSKADHMRNVLAKQGKVKILVPLEGKETKGVVDWVYNSKTDRDEQVHRGGAIQPVTLNGYQYLVPKGVYVEVPEQIAQVIQDKYQQTSEAGSNLLIDRIDPETGKQVSEQL